MLYIVGSSLDSEGRRMGFAILRVQKLKHPIAVQRSMKHALRTQETPNADASRLAQNTASVKSVDEALERFNGRLATQPKVRSNAVLAVEYLVTGSPEALQGKTRQEQDEYFKTALKWLQSRHKAENVVAWGIHRDETTPHLYAVVVPIDANGKLNCRHFLGGAKALSDMQSDFAEKVGRQHGLERGLQGSKAKHTSIRDYYARVNSVDRQSPNIDLPKPKLLESAKAYGKRAAQAAVQQLSPEILTLRAKAAELEQAKQEAGRERTANAATRRELKPVLDALRQLTPQNLSTVLNALPVMAARMQPQKAPEVAQQRPKEHGQELPRDR